MPCCFECHELMKTLGLLFLLPSPTCKEQKQNLVLIFVEDWDACDGQMNGDGTGEFRVLHSPDDDVTCNKRNR